MGKPKKTYNGTYGRLLAYAAHALAEVLSFPLSTFRILKPKPKSLLTETLCSLGAKQAWTKRVVERTKGPSFGLEALCWSTFLEA